MIIECLFVRTVFKSGDFSISSFVPTEECKNTITVNEKYGNFSISGLFPVLQKEIIYKFEIKQSENAKYPNSYELIRIITDISLQTQDMKQSFLQELVTERQYDTIISEYPDMVDRIIDDKPIDINRLNGIGEKTLNDIKNKIKSKYILMEIIGKYKDMGMSMNGLMKLLETYKSIDLIDEKMTKDPYDTLTHIAGIGFKKADLCIIKKYPHLIASEGRCLACIMYILKDNSPNTWMYISELYKKCLELCKESSIYFNEVIKNDNLYYDSKNNIIAIKKVWMCEQEICNRVYDKLENSEVWDIEYKYFNVVDGFTLSDEQVETMGMLCKYNIGILSGSAGAGKTASVRALIDMLKANNKTFVLSALTGKASKVLSKDTGEKATTVHRMLGFNPKNGYTYNKDNTLPYDVVIVDEFSMGDIFLIRDLLRAIKNETKLLFIGDFAQIPSISDGNVAYDMYLSKVIPTNELTKVFRYNEKGMIYVATEVRNGRKYIDLSNKGIANYGTYNYINMQQEQSLKMCLKLYKGLIDKGISRDDIVVITAMNKGEFGTIAINKMIQDIVNPYDKDKQEIKYGFNENIITFRVGDKIMQTKNQYAIKDINGEECDVTNGDTGYIHSIENGKITILFDNCMVQYDKSKLKMIDLCYSVNFFKMQGSGCENVIILTPKPHIYMLNRNLLYVGLTRARARIWHIGDINVINSALRKSENLKRNTFLCSMLKNKNNL